MCAVCCQIVAFVSFVVRKKTTTKTIQIHPLCVCVCVRIVFRVHSSLCINRPNQPGITSQRRQSVVSKNCHQPNPLNRHQHLFVFKEAYAVQKSVSSNSQIVSTRVPYQPCVYVVNTIHVKLLVIYKSVCKLYMKSLTISSPV